MMMNDAVHNGIPAEVFFSFFLAAKIMHDINICSTLIYGGVSLGLVLDMYVKKAWIGPTQEDLDWVISTLRNNIEPASRSPTKTSVGF